MPPKNKFTKQQIVDVAFDIAKEEGLQGITARRVAIQLGSSVAPIYVNFEDVDKLKKAVVHKVYQVSQQILKEVSEEKHTQDKFLDIGIASLRFAKSYSLLFRDLMLTKNDYLKDYDQELGNDIVQQMRSGSEMADFNEDELMTILLKMRIFQLGLSTMIANDLLPREFSEDECIGLMESMGSAVVTAARLKKEEGG